MKNNIFKNIIITILFITLPIILNAQPYNNNYQPQYQPPGYYNNQQVQPSSLVQSSTNPSASIANVFQASANFFNQIQGGPIYNNPPIYNNQPLQPINNNKYEKDDDDFFFDFLKTMLPFLFFLPLSL